MRSSLLLLSVAAACAACSSTAAGDPATSLAEPAAEVVGALDPSLPASPSDLDDDQIDALVGSEREPTPLADLLEAAAVRTPNLDEQLAMEEALQRCMAGGGFDYAIRPPVDPSAYRKYDDEYVVSATLGYGITSFLGRGPIAIGTVPIDPNEEYLSSLDEASQIAWYDAFDDCGRETGFLASPETLAREEEVYGELALLLEEIELRTSADPAVVDAWGAWRQCMTAAGHNYTNRSAIYQELSAERDGLLADLGPELLTGRLLLDDLPDDIAQQISDLQTRERVIAQADLTCRPGLDGTIYEARVKIEQAILDEDPARVDRILLALAELPKQY